MNKVLCATDLSEASRPVLMVAAALTRFMKGELELLHVIDLPPSLPPRFLRDGAVTDIQAQATAIAEERKAELATSGIDVRISVRLAPVFSGIVERAKETGAALLVMGTHARSGSARLFLGSVAEKAVREAPCPVLIVPPEAGGRLVGAGPYKRPLKVLAGIDATPASDAALEWLRDFMQDAPCDLRLVHLYWPIREHERLGIAPVDGFESDPEVTDVLARELKAHIASHLGRTDVALAFRAMWGAEEDPLAWEAETDDADLVVVGTTRRRGSTAIATVRSSRVPVLCVPGPPSRVGPARLKPVRMVLATTDFSPLANAAVGEAYRLLLGGGGTVVLAHVAEGGGADLDAERENQIETALLALAPGAARRHRIRTRTVVVNDSSPGEAIVKTIRRLAPDVVVMASHGRTGIGRAIHGSVTEHVARMSPRPLLIVPRPPDPS